MHDYSIDNHPKVKIIFWLTFLAVLVTPWVDSSVHQTISWAFPGLSAISVTAVFGVIYFAFDRWIWRIPVARRIMLVPDLNGIWQCTGTQLWQGEAKSDRAWQATITIVQSWSKMVVRLKTDKSESDSTSAAILHEPGRGYRLRFSYRNTPAPGDTNLRPHDGHCELVFNVDLKAATGQYFTDHQRLTHGSLTIARKGA